MTDSLHRWATTCLRASYYLDDLTRLDDDVLRPTTHPRPSGLWVCRTARPGDTDFTVWLPTGALRSSVFPTRLCPCSSATLYT